MQVHAVLKNHLQSPAKTRQVVNAVKDLPLQKALSQLKLMRKKAARPIYRLLVSAASNAQHNFGLKKEDLVIQEMQVGPGRTLKRVKPRARGRADTIRRRRSHVRVALRPASAKATAG